MNNVFTSTLPSQPRTTFGILLHHTFTRDEHHAIVQDWTGEIPVVAEKYAFLGA